MYPPPTRRELRPDLLLRCYAKWKMEYLAREGWVRYLENGEKQRRKRRNRLLRAVGLPAAQ